MRPVCRSRWLLAWSTGSSVLALAAAGCGGSPGEEQQAPPPALSSDVGALFVQETEEVTDALEAGEPEIARGEALELRQLVEEAIAEGRVPARLRAPLLEGIDRLIASIDVPVEPPPPPPPPPEEAPPETDGCDELETMQATLEEQRDALDKDDPARELIEDQLQAVKGQLKDCKKGGDGEEEDDGDDE